MKIDNIGFNLYMPKIDNLRLKSQEIEKKLIEYFEPFSILPIPEDAPEEIPRMIAKSYKHHSELVISLINVQLNINFDDKFGFDESFDYAKTRVDAIVDIFSEFSQGNFIFAGVTARVIIEEEEPIDFLEKNFLNVKSSIRPYNMSEKIAYLLEDKYFLNFNIYNLRTFEGVFLGNKIKPEVKETSHVLAVEVDMNDKYGFNHNEDHTCKKETIQYTLDKIKNYTRINIEKMLSGGDLIL